MKTVNKSTKNSKSEFDFRTIKFFEDACKKENVDPTKLPDVSMLPEAIGKDLVARYKLIIIFQAVNNGWIAKVNSSQLKWYAYFWLRSSGSGFVFSYSAYAYTYAGTYAGFRLCTETEEQIRHIVTQFTELFEDMILNKI